MTLHSDLETLAKVHMPLATEYVFLLEDDVAMRESLQRVLSAEGYRVCAFDDPQQFLDLVTPAAPAVAVLDMRLPGMSGVEVQSRLRDMGITMPVVFVSGESTVQQAIRAMENGAATFLIKPVSRNDLLASVRKAMDLAITNGLKKQRQQDQQASLSRLSPREKEVLGYLVKGFGTQDISRTLDIAYSTAAQYKTTILLKLGCRNRIELMAFMNVGT